MKKSLLIDLDGVLRIGDKPAEGINYFFEEIKKKKIKACILSNSSLYSSKHIYEFFNSNLIKVEIPIVTAVDAAENYIKKRFVRVAVYTSENVIGLFNDVLDFKNPEAVLIGDIGDVWNYELMQNIFEYVQNGAELVAMHKNKYWNKPEVGIQLDAGPFIHAIEYASSKTATLIGKPSKLYFQAALQKINCNINDQFIMIGDDLDSDITGAKNLGAETILIYTGKTKSPISPRYKNKIDHEVENLLEIINLL